MREVGPVLTLYLCPSSHVCFWSHVSPPTARHLPHNPVYCFTGPFSSFSSLHNDLRSMVRAVVSVQEHGVTYVIGVTQARSNARANLAKKYLVHEPFLFLVHNFTSHPDLAFGIPPERLAAIGLPYYLE